MNMASCWSGRLRVGLWVIGLCGVGLTASAALAQSSFKEAPVIRFDEKKLIDSYRRGDAALEKSELPLLTKYAQSYIYKLDDPETLKAQRENPLSEKALNAWIDKTVKSMQFTTPHADLKKPLTQIQKEFNRDYGLALLKVLVEKLQLPQSTEDANMVRFAASRILAELGKTGVEQVADVCLAILLNLHIEKYLAGKEEPYFHLDNLRLGALRGLEHLMSVREPGMKDGAIRDYDRRLKVVKTLILFIETPFPPVDPENLGAIQYLRRYAIRALGHEPKAILKDRAGEVQPATTLMRVIADDKRMLPPVSRYEQFEAAIGFCRMEQPLNIRGDIACVGLGTTILQLAAFKAQNPGDKSLPWKVCATRLNYEINAWPTHMPPKQQEIARELVKRTSNDILAKLADNQAPSGLNELNNWLKATASKLPEQLLLYDGVKTSQIEPR